MFGRLGSWAASKISSVVDKVVDVAKRITDKVIEKGSKCWNAFTGKATFDRAERLYQEISDRYDKKKREYELATELLIKDIDSQVSAINHFKQDIYGVQFKRFVSLANRLHNVTVKGQPFEELFDDAILEAKTTAAVEHREKLFLIDFNKFDLVRVASYVLTLGFYSRKKAKQTLLKVQEEEVRIDEEIAKMESHQRQLQVVGKSIDGVVEYFDVLINNYSKLLDRFEYGIQSQRHKQMALSDEIFALKLDFRLIPIAHIEEFQALFNLSIVLKQMANLGYLSENGKLKPKDSQQAKALFEKVASIQAIAA